MGYNGIASASKFNSTKVNKLFLIFKRHIKKTSWSIGRDMAFKWTFMNSNDTPMMFGGKIQSMHIIKNVYHEWWIHAIESDENQKEENALPISWFADSALTFLILYVQQVGGLNWHLPKFSCANYFSVK